MIIKGEQRVLNNKAEHSCSFALLIDKKEKGLTLPEGLIYHIIPFLFYV